MKSDSTNAGVRTVNGKVTLQGDIPLEIRAVVRTEDDKITIRIANTTGYKHWLAGKILEPGKMTIDVTLVSLDGGVIVDSTIKVKLEQMEDKAATFCSSLPMAWITSQTMLLTETVTAVEAQARAISVMATLKAITPASEPP